MLDVRFIILVLTPAVLIVIVPRTGGSLPLLRMNLCGRFRPDVPYTQSYL
jgi:hypothetical protein